MEGISFIIPNRGGKDLDKVIKNINEVYFRVNKEIIVVEQADDRPFMRGQLFNIGSLFASLDYLALTDNDIWHLREIPLFDIYNVYKCPLVCFKYISQLVYNDGKVSILETEERPYGFGAFTFLSKKDFMSVNGFSNLYIGWGCEDIDFISRFSKYVRIPQALGHLQHPRRVDVNKRNTELNREFFYANKCSPRNPKNDGVSNTTYTLLNETREGNVLRVSVENISVKDNYMYEDLLSKHF